MTKEQHTHELIDQYLNGDLAGQDLDKFKIRLKDDADFLRQVQVQKAIIQSIEFNRNAELKALLTSATSKRKFIIPFAKRPLAIAATLLSIMAFGLVLKTVLPEQMNRLSSSEEPVEDVAQDNEQQLDIPILPLDSQGKVVIVAQATSGENDSNNNLIVEVIEQADEMDDDRDGLLSNDSEVDFSELKKNEDQIDGSNVHAQRDSMLGTKSVVLWAYTYQTPELATKDSERFVEAEKVGKKNASRRKKRKQDDDLNQKADVLTTDVVEKVLMKQQSSSIRVEFWHSIVNFKGYKFDGSKLLLFDTPQDIALKIVRFNSKTYLKKGGTYYVLNPNNNFNQLSKVTDTDVLTTLNK